MITVIFMTRDFKNRVIKPNSQIIQLKIEEKGFLINYATFELDNFA